MNSKRTFWIFLAAVLAILSHPAVFFGWRLPDLSWLGFFAYAPLLYFAFAEEGRGILRSVFAFAFLFYSGTLYWLFTALNGYGHLAPPLALLVLLILVLILSAYLTIAFLLSHWIERRMLVSHFWTLPLIWVAVEWCRTHWPLGGFPWAQAGYSQWRFLDFIQISDLLGVYGCTALLVWVNLGIAEVARIVFRGKANLRAFAKPLIALLLLALNLVYGHYQKARIAELSGLSPHFKLALLQGNIPQDEKWLTDRADEILEIYQEMTRAAFLEKSDLQLAIWPEASFPYEIAIDLQNNIEAIGSFGGEVLLGAVTYENKGRLPTDILYSPLGYPIHNSALLIQPGPKLAGSYFKHHLVPYGEYIPLKKALPFIGKLTSQMGEFLEGQEYNLLASGPAKIGVLICYEDIFPQIARRLSESGANLLVNITNDAWYGDSSALPQHLSFSAFRAVENRKSLVRATNTGITASFDATGKIWAEAPPFERKILYDQVPLMEYPSFYSQRGDLFAYACLAISAVLMLGSLLLCRKN